jgi:hypothetical protein
VTDPEPVGSAAEEALKLMRLLATGAREAAQPGAGGSAATQSDDGRAAAADHTCPTGWCPVCRLTEWVRENPEVVESLTDAAVGLARAARDALDTVVRGPSPQRGRDQHGDDIADH